MFALAANDICLTASSSVALNRDAVYMALVNHHPHVEYNACVTNHSTNLVAILLRICIHAFMVDIVETIDELKSSCDWEAVIKAMEQDIVCRTLHSELDGLLDGLKHGVIKSGSPRLPIVVQSLASALADRPILVEDNKHVMKDYFYTLSAIAEACGIYGLGVAEHSFEGRKSRRGSFEGNVSHK